MNSGIGGHKIQPLTMPKKWKRERRKTGQPRDGLTWSPELVPFAPCLLFSPPPSKDLSLRNPQAVRVFVLFGSPQIMF